MNVKERNKADIESRLDNMGDYVKIDYLTACLKQPLDFDTRKFVLIRLAGIYENRGMFREAAKLVKGAAEINTTFQAKINDFMLAGSLFVRSGDHIEADVCFNAASACGNTQQKEDVKNSRKEFYKMQGRFLVDKDKRQPALKVYERLLRMELNSEEKNEVNEKLLYLYEKLGKIREYYTLKRSLGL